MLDGSVSQHLEEQPSETRSLLFDDVQELKTVAPIYGHVGHT